jgi:hypothetical protein
MAFCPDVTIGIEAQLTSLARKIRNGASAG